MLQLLLIPSIFLVTYFLNHDYGPKEPKKALWIALGFGVLSILITWGLQLVVENFGVDSLIDHLYESKPAQFAAIIVYASIEELAKFLPLAIWIYRRRYFEEITDGIIYFVIVGLTFGVIENLIYTLNYGDGTGIFRILFLLYFHGAITAAVGYWFAKGIILKMSWRPGLLALLGASVVHALYNFFSFNNASSIYFTLGSLAMTLMINVTMFVLFLKAQEIDYRRGQIPDNPVPTNRQPPHLIPPGNN